MSAAGNDGTVSEVDTCSSDERVDVHVLVVPVVAWRSDLRFAYSSVCLESASAGFVRVGIHTTLVSLREEIASQLSLSLLPGQYVFLRNLGRCFTWISCKQEEIMTVSMFIPPMTSSPEVYVLDGACFRGFPEGIVEPSRGVSDNSRHSFPIEHNRSMPVAHLPSQPLNQIVSLSPHHPDQNLLVMRSHDPMRSHDTSPLNFTSGNRKVAQQRLPNLLPQQKAAPRQRAYTSDGSDLVQHRRDDQQGHHSYARNTNTVHTNDYTSPSKAGSNDDSINSNSLSDHSYGIDELHQESEVLTTSYGPSWQSSATQSLIVADSAANSLCSTTLPSSLNGAHQSHSPTKSLLNSPHEVNSSGSKMLGPRVNVDLNLTDSVIAENTEALERALFGSRGDGEGSSLTNSLLNVTGGATSGHYLQQQNDQSQLQNNNHAQLLQPHPQLVLHHGSYSDQQNDHLSGHHDNISYTRSPSNHTPNGITSLGAMVTPRGYNGTIDHASANICTLNNDQLTTQAYNVMTSHSTVVEQLQNINIPPHSIQRSYNTPCDETTLSSTDNVDQRTNTRELDINTTTDNSPIDNNTVANRDPSNISLTNNSEQLSPSVGASVQRSMISNDSLDNTIPSEYQSTVYNSSEVLKQHNSVSSDMMAVRSSVEGDGCSQSRADITATVNNTVNNNVVTSHNPVEHHVTITDGEHQLEHSSTTAQSVSSDGVEQSDTSGLSSQHLSLPMPDSHQPSLNTCTVSGDGTSDCDKIVNQQSLLSQREAGVGTSMLFSTSPLPPITSSPDKNNSTSEANGKPVELDEVNQLLAQLRMARDDRRTLENVKRGLSDNVKKLQRNKKTTQDREDKKWKKMYFQEKRATQVNEERLRRLRNEVHRRMSTMATNGQQDTALRGVHPILSPIATSEGPSEALNVKIQCARVEQDLGKLRQRLLAAQEKLKVEKEARVMAETENKTIRKNVLQQKINCTLTRTT